MCLHKFEGLVSDLEIHKNHPEPENYNPIFSHNRTETEREKLQVPKPTTGEKNIPA